MRALAGISALIMPSISTLTAIPTLSSIPGALTMTVTKSASAIIAVSTERRGGRDGPYDFVVGELEVGPARSGGVPERGPA